jgi:AraC-like DNA-binding protein
LRARWGTRHFTFIRQFEALFGVTPHQYRIQARLDLAKQLLASGQYSVTDVCMEIGFSSLGSFITLFAQRVGEAPSAYRRRIRAAPAGTRDRACPTHARLSESARWPPLVCVPAVRPQFSRSIEALLRAHCRQIVNGGTKSMRIKLTSIMVDDED